MSRETQALSGAFLKDADSQCDKRFSVYNFTFFCELFFGTKLERHTPWTIGVTTMLSLMPLTSLWTLFMNVFVLAEWVCWLWEKWRERCVRTLCCRMCVFKSCIYDSAKGWGFTESPCFFQHLHFSRNVPYLRDCFFIDLPSLVGDLDAICFWFLILQPPTGQARIYCM